MPEDYEDEFEYLNELRESGRTNMFGAAPYLQKEFPYYTLVEAREILTKWMQSFEDAD